MIRIAPSPWRCVVPILALGAQAQFAQAGLLTTERIWEQFPMRGDSVDYSPDPDRRALPLAGRILFPLTDPVSRESRTYSPKDPLRGSLYSDPIAIARGTC
jgi:hypothetical protein